MEHGVNGMTTRGSDHGTTNPDMVATIQTRTTGPQTDFSNNQLRTNPTRIVEIITDKEEAITMNAATTTTQEEIHTEATTEVHLDNKTDKRPTLSIRTEDIREIFP